MQKIMNATNQPDIWRIVEYLSNEYDLHIVNSVKSPEDALVSILSGSSSIRQEALDYLRYFSIRKKSIWGSITPYLVFYFHLVYEKEDNEAAEEIKKILLNTVKSNQVSQTDEVILQILTQGYDIKKATNNKSIAANFEKDFIIENIDEPITDLVRRLVYVKIGGMTDLSDAILRVKRAIKKTVVDQEVVDKYLVPVYETIQPIDNYFVSKAEREKEKLSQFAYLLRKSEYLKIKRDRKIEKLEKNKKLKIIIVGAVVIGAAAFAVLYSILNYNDLLNLAKGDAKKLLIFISIVALPVISSLPIGRAGRLLLSVIIYFYTLKESIKINNVNKEIKEMPHLYEPGTS